MMIGKELTESHYEKVDASGHEIVAELDHVDYNKESKHSGLADLSLRIHAGEIVGVAGVDGNGQTQLAQLITGVIAPESGTVQLKGDRVADRGKSCPQGHRRSALQPRSWFAPEQARHPRLRAVHDGKI